MLLVDFAVIQYIFHKYASIQNPGLIEVFIHYEITTLIKNNTHNSHVTCSKNSVMIALTRRQKLTKPRNIQRPQDQSPFRHYASSHVTCFFPNIKFSRNVVITFLSIVLRFLKQRCSLRFSDFAFVLLTIIKIFKVKVILNRILKFISYSDSVTKTMQLILYKGKTAVCSELHKKHIKPTCRYKL